ncbi:MAG: GAF domain-containing protein [Thermodesulfobacteriota bacterium]
MELRESAASSSFQEFLDRCNEALRSLTKSRLSFIGFLDDEESVMTLPIWSQDVMQECRITGRPRTFTLKDAGIWAECVRRREPFVCNRYEEPHPGKKGLPEGHAGLTRFVSIPMMIGERVVAVSVVANKDTDYEEMDVSTLLALTNKVWEIHLLKQTEERVRRLAATVEQAALDVVITDAEGNILYTNPAVTKTTGYTAEELLGRNPRIFKSGKHDQAFYKDLWVTLKAGRTWNGRIHNRAKDGRPILQNATISPIRDEKDEIIGFVATRRDVTKEVEMEEHLAEAQKMEALGTLSGGIAHDFNNILTAIVGFTELCRLSCTEPEQKEYLDAVLKASGRATDLIKQILSFSRMGKEEARPVKPKLIVKEAMKLLRASIPTTIVFRQNIVSDSLVLADPGEIHRIVINLCTNASLAMKESGGVLEVSLEDVTPDASFLAVHPELRKGRCVCFTVKDTGCGMTDEVRARIFEPFFTTRKEGEGSGMGLSVVHGIVRSRGGAVTVASEPGKGSTFQVYLPVEQWTGAEEKIREEIPLPGDERILFVDDEAMVTQFVERSLGHLGYRISAFTSSRQALERFRANPDAFDLLVTDMTMPEMTGDVLAKMLREIRPDIPVIFCTGFSERMTPDKLEAIGNSVLALKPITAGHLSRIIRRLVDAKENPLPNVT